MSYTVSSQTFTPESVADIDVIKEYENLMKASVGKDSVYIRAKETLNIMLEDKEISSKDKANAISNMLSNITASLSNKALDVAFAVVTDRRNKPYELAKLKQDTMMVQEQRNKVAADNEATGKNVDKDIELIAEDVILKRMQSWKLQADLVRDNGVTLPTNIDTELLSQAAIDTASGKKYYDIEQAKISSYATMAKSFRENGVVSYTTDSAGAISSITDLQPETPGLTKAQYDVAVRQELAFEDNKVQHAANASATFASMLYTSGNSAQLTQEDALVWTNAMNYLITPAVTE